MRKASASKSSKSAAAHKSNNKNTTELLKSDFFEFLSNAFLNLNKSFQTLPEFKNAVPGHGRLGNVITATAERLRDNYPYFHPLYAGQMLKPPHPIARVRTLAAWSSAWNRLPPDRQSSTSSATVKRPPRSRGAA